MDVTTVQTHTHDTRIDLHWSSLATEPAIWMRIQGGASIDPRDPQHLALLPITNAALLNARQARKLAAELLNWADKMDEDA